MRTNLGTWLLVCGLASSAAGQGAASREVALSDPAYLSEEARAVLHQRMSRHADDVRALTFAVTLLAYEPAQALAKRIAAEPKLARPVAGDQESLNINLPAQFFTFQDQLKIRAEAVAASALKRDNAALASNFGRMMEVCVSCHAAYLYPPAAPKR